MNTIRTRLTEYDPRIKILLGLWFGYWAWNLGPLSLILLLVPTGGLFWILIRSWPGKPVLKPLGFMLAFWVGLKIGMDFLGTEDSLQAGEIVREGLVLGCRLLFLLLLGLVLTLATSPLVLSRGASWFLRPLSRGLAWKLSLSLALMIHSIPIILAKAGEVKRAVSLRCQKLSFPQKVLIFTLATLRGISQKTWEQTLAVAGRKMNRPEPWEEPLPFHFIQWSLGAAVALIPLLLP